jgi:hypothetical protein
MRDVTFVARKLFLQTIVEKIKELQNGVDAIIDSLPNPNKVNSLNFQSQ